MQEASAWLTKGEALAAIGIPERQFARLLARGLIDTTGSGTGKRFRRVDVEACAVLWSRLRPLLPPAKGLPRDEDDDEED